MPLPGPRWRASPGNQTLVTEADRAIERAPRERVASVRPDEGVYSDKPSGQCAHGGYLVAFALGAAWIATRGLRAYERSV